MEEKTKKLTETYFRYGMLFGERVVLNTVLTYIQEALDHPQVIRDALDNLSAVADSVEDEYQEWKNYTKWYTHYNFGEEGFDAEQQGQGEEV